MKVLLVGNYEADGQWSMDRFCKMLLRGLREAGVEAQVITPSVILGGRNKWLGYVDKFLLFWPALRRAAKGGWLVHVVDQGNGIYPLFTRICALTCHDLLAVRVARGEFPGRRTGWSGRILQRMILRGLRRANGIKGIVSVSGATQRDVRRLVGESEMIANGVEDFWQPMEPREAASRIAEAGAPAKEYLLHVGGGQWYKNRAGVVRGFIDLRTQTAHAPNLVLVGPPLDARLAAQLRQAALGKDVIVLHGVTDETLRALYSMARVFIFPSLEEGFGWPILEAQACGCPVVTTSREPMTDTGGEAAIYTNEAEWTKGAIEVLEMDDTRRAALVAAGMENARRYSVKKMAAAYIEFYKRHQ